MIRKFLYLFAFLIFGMPILMLSFGLGIGITGAVVATGGAAVLSKVSETENPLPWKITNASRADYSDLQALAAPQDYKKGRVVRIGYWRNFDEIRGDRREAVQPNDYDNYAREAAIRLARQECDILLSVFASKCAIASAEVTPSKKPSIYKIIIELNYALKAPFGAVSDKGENTLLSSKVNLSRNGAEITRIDRRGHVHMRREFYRTAMAECEKRRSRVGNCALHDVRISGSYNFEDQMISANATAKLVSIYPQ